MTHRIIRGIVILSCGLTIVLANSSLPSLAQDSGEAIPCQEDSNDGQAQGWNWAGRHRPSRRR